MQKQFYLVSFLAFAATGVATVFWFPFAWLFLPLGVLFALGIVDVTQTRQAVRRNFPVIGRMRYLLELIRPEINQYFIESNTDGTPFNREQRSVVYQRAKGELATLPFGTQRDVYAEGYEWMDHSMYPREAMREEPRVTIGGPRCRKPYAASLFNISAMSFGALSDAAVRALNYGAAKGGFFHNTGEGSVSPYHLEGGGDLCWQIGTGYFGCRSADGGFDAEKFRLVATKDSIKLIEVKLSQGAKPGHGGILPAAKITPEIAQIRGVPMGEDVVSPPYHKAFDTPRGLLEFLEELRELSGGKPVGFKLCVGAHHEFIGVCKAMVETGLTPDFITVDGGEGGTGAAPLEFSNSVGTPLNEGLSFVHSTLVGFNLRDAIRVIAATKVTTGFDIARRLALGADLCNSARGMMLAIGCIQARRCNSNHCPVGVATQNPALIVGLDVGDKSERVYRYHKETVEAFLDLLGAAGLDHPSELRPWHIQRRISASEVKNYAQIFEHMEPGGLLKAPLPESYERAMLIASAESF